MKILEYKAISSLTYRMKKVWGADYLCRMIYGNSSDTWWLDYPGIKVEFYRNYLDGNYDMHIWDDDGPPTTLLINKEDLMNILNKELL